MRLKMLLISPRLAIEIEIECKFFFFRCRIVVKLNGVAKCIAIIWLVRHNSILIIYFNFKCSQSIGLNIFGSRKKKPLDVSVSIGKLVNIINIEYHLHKLLNLQRNSSKKEYSQHIRDLIIFAASTKPLIVRFVSLTETCSANPTRQGSEVGGSQGLVCFSAYSSTF